MRFRAADFRRIARDKLKGKWGISLLVTLVASLLGGVGGGSVSIPGFNWNTDSNWLENLPSAEASQIEEFLDQFTQNPVFIGMAIFFITIAAIIAIALTFVGAPVELGHCRYYINLTNNEGSFGDLFSRFRIFWKAVGLRLFMMLFTFLWSLLLIVPGIIAAYRYAMAPYLMAQNPDKGIRECVNESKELMRGNKGRLFCLYFSFIGWTLLATLTLGIGFLWLNPYIAAAEAAFYLDLTGQGIPLCVLAEPENPDPVI